MRRQACKPTDTRARKLGVQARRPGSSRAHCVQRSATKQPTPHLPPRLCGCGLLRLQCRPQLALRLLQSRAPLPLLSRCRQMRVQVGRGLGIVLAQRVALSAYPGQLRLQAADLGLPDVQFK